MEEVEIAVTGIGGQGIQLLAKVLAKTALTEGRNAMLSSEYTGEMRGGRTFASVAISGSTIRALPVPERADAAIAMHHLFWEPVQTLLVPGSLILVERDMYDELLPQIAEDAGFRVRAIAAQQAANEVGNRMGAGLAMLGAFCELTGLASIDGLCAGMEASIPSYRKQHVPSNIKAIHAGAALVSGKHEGVRASVPHREAI